MIAVVYAGKLGDLCYRNNGWRPGVSWPRGGCVFRFLRYFGSLCFDFRRCCRPFGEFLWRITGLIFLLLLEPDSVFCEHDMFLCFWHVHIWQVHWLPEGLVRSRDFSFLFLVSASIRDEDVLAHMIVLRINGPLKTNHEVAGWEKRWANSERGSSRFETFNNRVLV